MSVQRPPFLVVRKCRIFAARLAGTDDDGGSESRSWIRNRWGNDDFVGRVGVEEEL